MIRVGFDLATGALRLVIALILVAPLIFIAATVTLLSEIVERLVTGTNARTATMGTALGKCVRSVARFGWTVGGLYPQETGVK